jgi:hypothetical protein
VKDVPALDRALKSALAASFKTSRRCSANPASGADSKSGSKGARSISISPRTR